MFINIYILSEDEKILIISVNSMDSEQMDISFQVQTVALLSLLLP